MVEPILYTLPEEVQMDIIFLLLLAPSEEDNSFMNTEFNLRIRHRLPRKLLND